MNSSVLDQADHGFSGNLAFNGVEPGKHNGVGRVVDQHRDACGGLEGSDIAPLPADNPPLDLLVAVQQNGGRCSLVSVFAGVALYSQPNDPTRFFLCMIFCTVNDGLGNLTRLHLGFVSNDFKKTIPRIVRAQAGNFAQRLLVLLDQLLRRSLCFTKI